GDEKLFEEDISNLASSGNIVDAFSQVISTMSDELYRLHQQVAQNESVKIIEAVPAPTMLHLKNTLEGSSSPLEPSDLLLSSESENVKTADHTETKLKHY